MAKQKAQPAQDAGTADTDQQQQQLQLHIPPDLEYTYRDMFSVFVGAEDVVLEFGNRHRSVANRATVGNRIVLSVANAFRLQQALGQMLESARQRIQAQAAANADASKSNSKD